MRRNNRLRAIGAAFVVTMLCRYCAAGTFRHDQNPLIHALLATNPAFDSVALVEGWTTSYGYNGSGTLIAPDVVLTAAHVVDEAVSLDVTIADTTYSADMWGPFPAWRPNNPLALIMGYDIGLIHLDTPVPDITPATRYQGNTESGQVGIFAGYGSTGTGLTGELIYDGIKRVGLNTIDTFLPANQDNSRIFLVDFDNPLDPTDSLLGSPDPLDLEYLIASGDSGGPVFLPTDSGIQVAGVHSFGFGFDFISDSDYGDITGHTRVTVFNDWIDAVIQAFDMIPPEPTADDIVAKGLLPGFAFRNHVVPEPTTLILALLGAGLILGKNYNQS